MGGAFRDQLEKWELSSAQPKAPVKQNELTACWRVTLLCLEKTRKIHLCIQPYSDTISVWGKFRIVSAEQSRAGILYIVDTLLLQEPHPSISPSQYIFRELYIPLISGLETIQIHLFIWIGTRKCWHTETVLGHDCTQHNSIFPLKHLTIHCNCANVKNSSTHKFTSLQQGTKSIIMIATSCFLWMEHSSLSFFIFDYNFSDFLRW